MMVDDSVPSAVTSERKYFQYQNFKLVICVDDLQHNLNQQHLQVGLLSDYQQLQLGVDLLQKQLNIIAQTQRSLIDLALGLIAILHVMFALFAVMQHRCAVTITFDDFFNELGGLHHPHLPSKYHYDGVKHLWLFFLSSILACLHFLDQFVSAVVMGPILMVESMKKLFVEQVEMIELVYLIEPEILVSNFH